MKSSLPPELLAAYKDTDYIVYEDPPLVLRIGEANDDAAILLASFGVISAAFITASNPGSKRLSADENIDRQAELLNQIEQLRYNYFVGCGEREDWYEDSYLILGISLEEASELATRFEQNAYVWIGENGVPELVCLN